MCGWMYILECYDGTFYTGSTVDLERRLRQHQDGEGSCYTQKRLPVKLIYTEFYDRIDFAFYREKQVQGWSRKKKLALIQEKNSQLPTLSVCQNDTSSKNYNPPPEWFLNRQKQTKD